MAYTAGPFDRKHLYLQWGGALPGGEQWSCGIRLAAEGSQTANDVSLDAWDIETHLTSCVTAVTAMHQSSSTLISPRATLGFVKLNRINTAGHYDEATTHQRILANLTGGGASSPAPPNQIAWAITTTTRVSRGPAHSGRFYLPMPVITLGTDGLIPTASVQSAAVPLKAFIEAISDVPGVDVAFSPGAVVMSRKSGAPATHQITGIAIGRVLDTQRRRRRKLTELYAATAVDQGAF